MNASSDLRKIHGLQLWGHRGGRGPRLPPENSLSAFGTAIAHGADGVELDVFLTRDRELVVFHDEHLGDLSDGCGPIEARTLDELRGLRLKTFAGTLSSERIPTLREVLEFVHTWREETAYLDSPEGHRARGFVVNIETKGINVARQVIDEVQHWMAAGWTRDNFLNSSFNLESLQEMRELLPDLSIGALFEGPLGQARPPWDLTLEELRKCIRRCRSLGVETINITLPSLRVPGALDLIRAANARPVAWTSGEQNPELYCRAERDELLQFLVDHNVVLITDFPGAFRKVERTLMG